MNQASFGRKLRATAERIIRLSNAVGRERGPFMRDAKVQAARDAIMEFGLIGTNFDDPAGLHCLAFAIVAGLGRNFSTMCGAEKTTWLIIARNTALAAGFPVVDPRAAQPEPLRSVTAAGAA